MFTIQLIVNNGFVDSSADDVNVTVIGPLETVLTIMPKKISIQSNQPYIQILMPLPAGILAQDVNSMEPILLYPGEINAAQLAINAKNKAAEINAVFDKDSVLSALQKDAVSEIKIVGKLNSGQYFYGANTIEIGSTKGK